MNEHDAAVSVWNSGKSCMASH